MCLSSFLDKAHYFLGTGVHAFPERKKAEMLLAGPRSRHGR